MDKELAMQLWAELNTLQMQGKGMLRCAVTLLKKYPNVSELLAEATEATSKLTDVFTPKMLEQVQLTMGFFIALIDEIQNDEEFSQALGVNTESE
jgi:hypothetical protein